MEFPYPNIMNEIRSMRERALPRDVLRGPKDGFLLFGLHTRADAINWLLRSALGIVNQLPKPDFHPENPALRALGVLLDHPLAGDGPFRKYPPEAKEKLLEMTKDRLPWWSGQLEWQWAQYVATVREQLVRDPRFGTGMVHPALSLTMEALKELETLISWGLLEHENDDIAHGAAAFVSDKDAVFAAAAENLLRGGADNATRRLLREAWIQARPETTPLEQWPSKLAEALSKRLSVKGPDEPGWVVFAAAAATSSAVHVCWAGDLRVHVIPKSGTSVSPFGAPGASAPNPFSTLGAPVASGASAPSPMSTRDHVLANEDPAWAEATFGPDALEIHGSMLTRSLGRSGLPFETARFDVSGPFTLLFCSTGLHAGRSPSDEQNAKWDTPWTATKEGFAMRIPR